MTTPSITPAQVLSSVVAVLGLLVTQGLIDNGAEKLIGGLASIVIPAAWQLADAVIRHGRAHNIEAIRADKALHGKKSRSKRVR